MSLGDDLCIVLTGESIAYCFLVELALSPKMYGFFMGLGISKLYVAVQV